MTYKTNETDELKKMLPHSLKWDDRVVEFKVLDCIHAANIRAGLAGLRYTIRLYSSQGSYRDTFLYYDKKPIGDDGDTSGFFVVV